MRAEIKCAAHGPARTVVALLAALACTASLSAWSDDYFTGSYRQHGFSEEDFSRMEIVPPRMMDSETLFLSAAVERDSSMNLSERLFNNRWLFNQGQADRSGAEGLRNYLRRYIVDNWKEKQAASDEQGYILPVAPAQKTSQFQDLSNYNLRVSDDKIHLKFKYDFD